MLQDPIGQRQLESDITPRLLGLNPFVPEDFLKFRLELFVKR